MSTQPQVTLVYLDEPCPMCGSEWATPHAKCNACGEAVDDEFPEHMTRTERPARQPARGTPTPMMRYRIVGVAILCVCVLLWRLLAIGSATSTDAVWTVIRVIGIVAIIYCGLIGTFAVVAGRPPRHHQWN